jgi:hypothetical protein
MKYDVAQAAIEQHVLDGWTETVVQYDNVAFNSEVYTEYMRCHVAFGEGIPRSVTRGCTRHTGILFLTIFSKPGQGSQRKLELASAAAELVDSVVISPIAPAVAPKIQMTTASLTSENKELNGWVQSIVSCPFYYDLRN